MASSEDKMALSRLSKFPACCKLFYLAVNSICIAWSSCRSWASTFCNYACCTNALAAERVLLMPPRAL